MRSLLLTFLALTLPATGEENPYDVVSKVLTPFAQVLAQGSKDIIQPGGGAELSCGASTQGSRDQKRIRAGVARGAGPIAGNGSAGREEVTVCRHGRGRFGPIQARA